MTVKPVLFSTPLVQAILEGRKHSTRRPIKPQPPHSCRYEINGASSHALCLAGPPEALVFVPPTPTSKDHRLPCPLGKPGDRLYVRETWQPSLMGDVAVISYPTNVSDQPCGDVKWLEGEAHAKAVEMACSRKTKGWLPSIHMPRWASRLTLEVTDVRVERLQDLTEEDAIAEGARRWPDIPDSSIPGATAEWSMVEPKNKGECLGSARFAFANLWNRIYGGENWNLTHAPYEPQNTPWDRNEWVWAVTFKRVEP